MNLCQLKYMLKTQPSTRIVSFGFGKGVKSDDGLGVIFELVENVKVSVLEKEVEFWLEKFDLVSDIELYFVEPGKSFELDVQIRLARLVGDSVCDF